MALDNKGFSCSVWLLLIGWFGLHNKKYSINQGVIGNLIIRMRDIDYMETWFCFILSIVNPFFFFVSSNASDALDKLRFLSVTKPLFLFLFWRCSISFSVLTILHWNTFNITILSVSCSLIINILNQTINNKFFLFVQNSLVVS